MNYSPTVCSFTYNNRQCCLVSEQPWRSAMRHVYRHAYQADNVKQCSQIWTDRQTGRQRDRLEVGRTDKVNTCQSQAVRTSEIGDDSREKCTSMLDVECSAAWSCQYVRPRQLRQLHGSFAGTYVNRQQLQPQQQQQQHVRHF